MCPGKNGKPTIVISKDYKVFLGNLTDEEAVYTAGELFGFNLGAFEIKLISGCLLRIFVGSFGWCLKQLNFLLSFFSVQVQATPRLTPFHGAWRQT